MSAPPSTGRDVHRHRAAARPKLRAPDGPLRANATPEPPRAARPPSTQRPSGNRVGRFRREFGWRAYAIPILTIATFLALMDVARGTETPTGAEAMSTELAQALSSTSSSASGPGADAAASPSGTPSSASAPSSPAAPSYVEAGGGQLSVVPGTSAVLGTGELRKFQVEIETGINMDGAAFAKQVEDILSDPRSWGAGGQFSFQRVDTDDYDFKVSLVSPAHVEGLCPGYGTEGYTSCRYEERAVINLARWVTAVPDYAGDLTTYRQYVINHEVGHWFGNGHVACPGPGQIAPVMQQQTLGLQGCVKNAWPYPNGTTDIDPGNPNGGPVTPAP